MENERLAQLVKEAKGERSIREYSRASKVNPTTISKIISKGYTPSSSVIRKLGSPEARPQGGVTIQDLMIAAGYADEYIKPDVLYHTDDGKTVLIEAMTVNREQKDPSSNRVLDWLKRARQFETIARGVIYSTLAEKDIMFVPGKIAELDVIGHRPDFYVKLPNRFPETWWFDCKLIDDGRDLRINKNREFIFRMFAHFVMSEADKNRKISIVIDNEEAFEMLLAYKGKLSYRGDLSLILIDSDDLCVLREEYISFYDPDDTGQNKILLI